MSVELLPGGPFEEEDGFVITLPLPSPSLSRSFSLVVASKPNGNVIIIPIPTSHEASSVPIDVARKRDRRSPQVEKGISSAFNNTVGIWSSC